LTPSDNNPNPNDEIPVAALDDFEEDVSPDFVPRLRRRLHRRVFSGQVASFSYNVPAMLLREFLLLIFGFFTPANRSSDSGPRNENRP
jgi:hypothetical protein